VHKFHRFHTLSNHFYISRPIFIHRPTFEAWPAELQDAMRSAVIDAVAFQRELHVEEEEDARKAIAAQGCAVAQPTAAEHDLFAAAVKPLIDDARRMYGDEMFALVRRA
jgi:TRAP-type C4-dicarboxylate transport system substrate-binding protein